MLITTGTMSIRRCVARCLIFELAAVGDRVAGRQTDSPADSILNLTDEATEIPSADV